MNPCYILRTEPAGEPQRPEDTTYIGGRPRLPETQELPACALCGAELTFFFQVAFPQDHFWSGLTMAMFACTGCADESSLIPEMLGVPLQGADIPEGFLTGYQRNFKALVFPTEEGRVRESYGEKIRFRRWRQERTEKPGSPGSKVGGQPVWLIGDEAPATYRGSVPMLFAMQLEPELKFELLPDAPPQIQLSLRGKPEPSKHRYYELFLRNHIYFFGTEDRTEALVYILTQI